LKAAQYTGNTRQNKGDANTIATIDSSPA